MIMACSEATCDTNIGVLGFFHPVHILLGSRQPSSDVLLPLYVWDEEVTSFMMDKLKSAGQNE